MKKIGLLFALMVGAMATYAQTGNLVIFSDEGSKFFVVVNGLRVNDQAQTNVRVTGLNADYVNCKIVFENELTPDIEKKTMMLVRGHEVTYIVKKNKKGETVCNAYSDVDLNTVQNTNTPNQQTVVYSNVPYNDGVVIRTGNGSSTTTTTTTTTTGTVGNTDVTNANVNVGGVGMNVTIYDSNGGVVNGSTTSTTTTTYSSTTTTGNTNSNYNNGTTTTNYNNGCVYGMSESEFRDAKSSITNGSFEDTKSSTFKQIVSNKCVTTRQVKEMLGLFSFEDTKLSMAKYAYSYVADPSNYYTINDIFSFDSSKDELSNYVMSNKR